MSGDTTNRVPPPLDHAANECYSDANTDSSMDDLVNRLDTLVQSYSAELAQPELPAHPTLTNETSHCNATSSDASQATACKRQQDEVAPQIRPEDVFGNLPQRGFREELKAARIMMVDDEEVNILTVQHHLQKEGFENFLAVTDPSEAIKQLRRQSPDVVLLDIRMPVISGLDILRAKRLDSSLEHIPVIVLTAATDPDTKRLALDLGATDFLAKPVDPHDLAPRVRNALAAKNHYDQKADEAAKLEEIVRRRTAEVVQSREQLILSLARAAEHRDNETGNHVLRVGRFARIIANEMGWSESQSEMIERAAPLHDVGKIGVPDGILFKEGKLDPQEFEIIKNHCAWGKQIIEPFSEDDTRALRAHARVGESILHVRHSTMLMMASRIAQTHHENWDGTGYPLGLAGEDIPLEGRITAVADVYDALSTKRSYKPAFSREKCFAILKEQRGKKFDPRVLDAFLVQASQIIAIQLELIDHCPPERFS